MPKPIPPTDFDTWSNSEKILFFYDREIEKIHKEEIVEGSKILYKYTPKFRIRTYTYWKRGNQWIGPKGREVSEQDMQDEQE